jgi:pilus assembly protein CpaC
VNPSRILILVLLLLVLRLERASAQEASSSPSPSAEAGEEVKERKRRRAPEEKASYARSRFSADRSEAEADHRALLLTAGVDKTVDLEQTLTLTGDMSQKVLIGNLNVVKVLPVLIGNKKQLIFKPEAVGETNVTIRDDSGQVRLIFEVIVAQANQIRNLERLRENLKEVEGISINIEERNIVLRGEVLTTADFSLVNNELAGELYGKEVVNKVRMSPVTLNFLAKRIEQDVQVFAPTVRATVINGKIILDGTVESEGIKQRAYNRAYFYLPMVRFKDNVGTDQNVIEMEQDKKTFILQSDITVQAPPPKRESKLVRMTVYFVELGKDFLKQFGFKWQPGFASDPSISIGTTASGGVGTSGGGFSFSGTLTSLFPTINSPPSNASYGRIMKSATIVVKNKEEGEVRDQVQVPTQSLGQGGTQGNGQPVQVGFHIKMTPTILEGQDVDVNIDIEQSNQVGKGANGTPVTANHKVKTRLYLKSGETAALTAVNKTDVATSFNRDDAAPGAFQQSAGAAQTKPLFSFQRSKNMSKARGQFVIFVNPQIIDSASEGTEDLKKNFRMTSSSR